uniref:IP04039p n=2 Tax=melanogaster subgroup TaxID=32351 RepID=Q1RKR3_DROME|nr:IP04039p [Drosophila melanogaster]
MLPRIKPVRNISYASLIPGPRSLNTHTNRNLSPV